MFSHVLLGVTYVVGGGWRQGETQGTATSSEVSMYFTYRTFVYFTISVCFPERFRCRCSCHIFLFSIVLDAGTSVGIAATVVVLAALVVCVSLAFLARQSKWGIRDLSTQFGALLSASLTI